MLEEFIPIKKYYDEGDGVKREKDYKDKNNWISSVQL